MWEVTLGPHQSENVVNNVMAQTSKPELDKHLYAALFIPTTASILKVIKQRFPEYLARSHRKTDKGTP